MADKFMGAIVFVAIFMIGMFAGLLVLTIPENDTESWQAALHMSNWTNRTLDLTIYVFASDTVQYELTIEHEANATLTVTWQDMEETIVLIHAIGEDVDGWLMYELEPGEWQTVILI